MAFCPNKQGLSMRGQSTIPDTKVNKETYQRSRIKNLVGDDRNFLYNSQIEPFSHQFYTSIGVFLHFFYLVS